MGLFVLILSALNLGWVYLHWTSPDDSHWNVQTVFNATSGEYIDIKITNSPSWAWKTSATNWSRMCFYHPSLGVLILTIATSRIEQRTTAKNGSGCCLA